MTHNAITQREGEQLLFEEWQNRLKQAASQMDRDQWTVADLLSEGEAKFGRKGAEAGHRATLYAPQTIKLAIETVRAFPPDKRLKQYKFLTHARVKAIGDELEQREFFELAGSEGWGDVQIAQEIGKQQLIENQTKVTKDLFQLESVFKFTRQFSKIESNFEKLPEGQREQIVDEVRALAQKMLDFVEAH